MRRVVRALLRIVTAELIRMLVEPALHRLKNVFMLPSGDPPLLAGGTAMLDGAAVAGIGPVAVQDEAIFFVRVPVGEEKPPNPESGREPHLTEIDPLPPARFYTAKTQSGHK
jgi:hypothetical protein